MEALFGYTEKPWSGEPCQCDSSHHKESGGGVDHHNNNRLSMTYRCDKCGHSWITERTYDD